MDDMKDKDFRRKSRGRQIDLIQEIFRKNRKSILMPTPIVLMFTAVYLLFSDHSLRREAEGVAISALLLGVIAWTWSRPLAWLCHRGMAGRVLATAPCSESPENHSWVQAFCGIAFLSMSAPSLLSSGIGDITWGNQDLRWTLLGVAWLCLWANGILTVKMGVRIGANGIVMYSGFTGWSSIIRCKLIESAGPSRVIEVERKGILSSPSEICVPLARSDVLIHTIERKLKESRSQLACA